MTIGVFLLRLSLQSYIFYTIESMFVGERIIRMLVAINQNFLTFGLYSYSGHSMLSMLLSLQSPRFDGCWCDRKRRWQPSKEQINMMTITSVVLLGSTRRQAKWLPSRFMTPRSATTRFELALC